MDHKIAFLYSLFACLFFSIASNSSGINIIFKTDSLDAASEDPYKSRPLKLGNSIVMRIPEKRRSFYEDQQGTGMITPEGQVKNDTSLVRIDDFVFDENVCLGNGVDGTVYLAQHIPTKTFVAVKSAWPLVAEIRNNEYESLIKLKRIFAYYSFDLFLDGKISSSQKQTYKFIPLVEGDIIGNKLAKLTEVAPVHIKEKIVSFAHFEIRLSLIKSLLAELRYLSQCGIYQP